MANIVDELIRKSMDIEQEISRIYAFTKEGREKRERLQKEADELWAQAKELGRPNVTRRNYEDLANAIVSSAATDYEDLISGTVEPSASCNLEELQRFSKEQTYVSLDMSAMLEKVDRIYREKFLPYAKKHATEIAEQWRNFNRQGLDMDIRVRRSKHKCPLCGGCLKPHYVKSNYSIDCTGCNLKAYSPTPRNAVSF